jgi:hypothetical protein
MAFWALDSFVFGIWLASFGIYIEIHGEVNARTLATPTPDTPGNRKELRE